MRMLLLCVAVSLCVAATPTDELIRRARQALTDGERACLDAGDTCRAGDYEKCVLLLAKVRESVELADSSLQATGIDPARNPRHFKDAEIRIRKILRLFDDLRTYVHPEDHADHDAARRRISEINDQLLSAIMAKKRKPSRARKAPARP